VRVDEQLSDEDLIRRACDGDTAGFQALVERWLPRMHRWVLGMLDDPDEAEDVVQEVLVRLYLKLGAFRGEARFSTWLYQLTRNAARDARRRTRRRERRMAPLRGDELAAPARNPAAELERHEDVTRVRHAMAALPERQREVFDLVEFQGYAPTEVAALLNLSPGTTRAHLFRARRAVRAAVLGADAPATEARP